MKAVILAAGKSTRTYPLTLTKPKPLLKVGEKTIIERNLEAIRPLAEEAIVVAGYKKDMLVDSLGYNFNGLKISYVEQKEQLGTSHALSLVEDNIGSDEKFILMLGDNLYSQEDIRKCISYDSSILTAKIKDLENFGVIVEKNGVVVDLIEKPKTFVSDKIIAGVYVFNNSIFSHLKRIDKSSRGELELPDAIKIYIKNNKLHCVDSSFWIPIGFPQDLLKADIVFRDEKNLVGEDTIIEGEVINSNIGKDCTIKGKVEDSIIMSGTTIEKGSLVKDSIFGEKVYFSGEIESNNGIGAFIGDGVKASDVSISSGCRIWPYKRIKGDVTKDVM